jgi:acetyl esterase/lipase
MCNTTFWTRQPGFFIYTTYTIVKALIKLPCLMLLYIVPHFRPLREWTYQQAFARALTRLLFEYASVVEFSPAQSLDPGKEKDRFVTIEPFTNPDENEHDPQTKSIYTGIAKPSSTPNSITPTTIGGTWFPAPITPTSPLTCARRRRRRIFLHFHGGAYVLFDCRDRDMAFGASLLLQASGSSSSRTNADDAEDDMDAAAAVFCPQYRLASHHSSKNGGGGGRFPAALQDAITAYAHLVLRLGVDAWDVVLSGDSAGGNLALALLRYLEETRVLPLPGGVVLWSPWTDLSVPPEELRARVEDRFDIVPVRVVEWGLRVFLPEGCLEGQACENAYVSPVKKGIETEVPVWVQVGGKEIIREDILRWVEVQRRVGKRLRVYENANAPHDMFMAGEGLGFVRESREAAEDAIRFLDGREETDT